MQNYRTYLVRFALVVMLLSMITGVTGCVCAQGLGHNETKLDTLPQQALEVVKVLLAQERAWNEGDLNAFASGYKRSPDTIFIGHEFSRGWDNMVASYRKTYPTRASMGTLTFSDLEPKLLGSDHALLVGRFRLERSKKEGGNTEGIFSLVFEKTPDGWKIILDHTT